MNEKRFEIDTPIGKLVAEAGGDYKDYPGIYIYLQREDGVQIDLSCTEVDKETGEGRVFVWENTSTDEYTKMMRWTKEQLMIKE